MNKSKFIYLLTVLIVIAGGLYVWKTSDANQKDYISNGEMLKSKKTTPILTETNVEYFEGAKGYFARPEAEGAYPAVVMIHENRGLRPETKFTADQLAKEGYMVLAVDLLGGKAVETQDEAKVLSANFKQDVGIKNMQAAVAYLKSQGATKVGTLGWCFGGAQSLQLSLSGEKLDATVIYYGRLATTTKALSPIKWPVLGVFGEEDKSISTSSVRLFEKALKTLGVKNEIYIFPGVGHAFANPSGMNYAPVQTKDAWGKTLLFLEKNLKPTTGELPKKEITTTPTTVQSKNLIGTSWMWSHTTLLNGEKVTNPTKDKFVLTFGMDKRANSTTDCNAMSGTYVLDGEVLSFGPFISTKMYCENSVENTYASELSLATSYSIKGDTLTINLNRDAGVMTFTRKK